MSTQLRTVNDRFEFGVPDTAIGFAPTWIEAKSEVECNGKGAYVFDRMARKGMYNLWVCQGGDEWKMVGRK
jgi:hypothetical protein